MVSKKKNKSAAVSTGAVSLRKVYLLILVALAIMLYANTLFHGYAFDDTVVITGNKFTQQGVKGIPDLLTKDLFSGIYGKALELSGGRYRPLSLVMFAVEYELFGANPFVGHFINILLYGLIAWILFLMMEELFPGQLLLGFISCLLFIVHPVHTEVVANIKSRDELLSLLGLALALLYLFRFQRTQQKKYVVYGCVAYFLSLLSKENGITFLFILPLSLFCFSGISIRKAILTSLPWLITAVVFVGIRTYFVGIIGDRDNPDIMENPFVNSSLGERTATVMRILGNYLRLLFFPHPLSSDYSYNQIPFVSWGDVSALLPFGLYAGAGIWALITLNKKTSASPYLVIVSWSVWSFIATIFLVSNLVFNIGAPMGERFLFLPSLLFCIGVSALILHWLKINPDTVRLSGTLLLIIVPVVAAFSYKTLIRNPDWKDNITLFAADVKNSPNSAKARYYYGNILLSNAMKQKVLTKEKQDTLLIAYRQTLMAASINPKFHHAFYNLGLIFQELGNADSAIFYYQKVLALQPTHIFTQGALGTVYGKLKGDYNNAIVYLSKAVQYNPQDASSWENLGVVYAMKGQTDEAIKAFEHSLSLNPSSAQAYLNLGVAWHNKGDQKKSDEYMEKAFQLDPSLRRK